jgi:hypothetical protein
MGRRVEGSYDMKQLLISVAALVLVSASSPPGVETAAIAATGETGGETLVSVGSPTTPFSQNKQLEPAVAIDAAHPNVVVAGARDQIDMASCDAGDPATCPFSEGVGYSGVYFSFDAGASWTQPTYEGWTARHCLGPEPCVPDVGPIGTLPGYYGAGLRTIGRVSLAFGPIPDASGDFSWANGSRLYFANIVENFPGQRTFKGPQAVAVSHTDDVTAAAAGDANAWSAPTIVTRQEKGFASDEDAVWADNAASSPYFGSVYVCASSYRRKSVPLVVSISHDGGITWTRRRLADTPFDGGCTIRTDSRGGVYVFAERSHEVTETALLFRSSDGGATWTGPKRLHDVFNVCIRTTFDGGGQICVYDGVGGLVQAGSANEPSVDIANGAPTGVGATDVIARTWVDGADGLNHEHVLVSLSNDGGDSWSQPSVVERPGERGFQAAVALSPDGTDAYLVYSALTSPFRQRATTPRGLVTVVIHSEIAANGNPSGSSELHRSVESDPRGSSFNGRVVAYLGEYIYAAATNTHGIAVWNDTRNAAHCPAVDIWRGLVVETLDTSDAPAPGMDCPPTFGNSDIFGATLLDPSS